MGETQVIEQWSREELENRDRLRPADAPPPTVNPAGMSGMEIFNAIFSGDQQSPPMGETLNFVPTLVAHATTTCLVFDLPSMTPKGQAVAA